MPEVTDLTGVDSDSEVGNTGNVCESDSEVEIVSLNPQCKTPRQCIQDAIKNSFNVSPIPQKRSPCQK